MKFLLDADDDWIESFRRFWYPKLHPILRIFGGYAVGVTPENQRVGTVLMDEETFEGVLVSLGFERNPIACYKSRAAGDSSEGSWALRSHDDPHRSRQCRGFSELHRDRQLHLTLFANSTNPNWVDVYAHEEYDWQDKPGPHLRGEDFNAEGGKDLAYHLLSAHANLSLLK